MSGFKTSTAFDVKNSRMETMLICQVYFFPRLSIGVTVILMAHRQKKDSIWMLKQLLIICGKKEKKERKRHKQELEYA